MIVLALDPSLTAFGYAVVNTETDFVLTHGCIKTKPAKPVTQSDVDRITLIAGKLYDLCVDFKVEEIWSETSVGSKSSSAAKALNLCKGMLIGLSATLALPLRLTFSQGPKLLLAGDRNATKQEVEDGVFKIWGKKSILYQIIALMPAYHREAVVDSLAVYLYLKEQHGPKTNSSTNSTQGSTV